ncbi:hypothetical protein [Proteus mirabilis]|uniref:hypothetical protein n=2 Tax=Proteus mirabilis TaxID=584 RepID=UPI00073BFE59|nr:hypothetical protein [Proteus mirabilis]NAC32652.1 hypothetical protein [Escherichia coli]ELZ9636549.1 hypothetical protein [Proteus mirabilis]KSX98895.1 hypothetical protein APT96_05950 [Proteus mirabilis]MBS3828480.1 hypothetical protein [Proteus mirabilis]MBS3839151.1 hypothetical protein [Proteus mirabilis]
MSCSHSLLGKDLFKIILFFSIFCSFNFIPFISAEIQPIIGIFIILFSIFNFVFFQKINKSGLVVLFFFIILLPSLIYGIKDGLSNAATYFMYMIGPAIFCYFYKNFDLLSTKQIKFYTYIFVCFSIVQTLSPEFINNLINPYFELLIKRARFGTYGDMRGVGILYSEPAHAAKYIFLIFIFIISYRLTPHIYTKNSNFKTTFLIVLTFICVILNKSASLYFMFLLLLIIFLFFYFFRISSPKIIISSLILIILPIYIWLSYTFNIGVILPTRISSLIDSFWMVKDRFTLNDIQYFGSIRLISVISGYVGGIIEPMGVGIGNGGKEIFLIMNKVGFDTNSITFLTTQNVEFLKPNSYGAQIALESGLLGLTFIIILSIYCFSQIRVNTNVNCFYSAVLVISIFQILFFSTTTVTAPWLMLALSLYALKRLNKNEYSL